ncbi:MAG: chitobiase/beta-hexosaminidase C-terminal domain-containing protein, partial [Bacteroidota bacterium]
MKFVYRSLWLVCFTICLQVYSLAQLPPDIVFSMERGYFDTPFSLDLQSKDSTASIRYTLDGSLPSADSGLLYTGPISIQTTSFVRAIAFRTDTSSQVLTHTYFFLPDIINHGDMDQDITLNPLWRAKLPEAFEDIPTVSLVGDQAIVEPSPTGLSVEFILPEESTSIHANAGAKYYGRASLNSGKKNIRLYFSPDYGGPGRLDFPLFKDHERGIFSPGKFDHLELRGDAHESWATEWFNTDSYIGPRFYGNTMLDMGNVHSHGRYVHLFLNGAYLGQYHLRERMNDGFMAEYFG